MATWFWISLALVFMNRTTNMVVGKLENALALVRQQNEAREKAEAALRESERAHRALVQTLAVGVIVHAPEGHIVFANDSAAKLMGLRVEQMIGKEAVNPTWRILNEDGSSMPLKGYPVARVLATQAPITNMVLGVQHPNNKEPDWVMVNAFPEFDSEGSLHQIVVSFIDITWRKKAEETLEENRQFLVDLFEHNANTIFVKDMDGRYEMINHQFEEEMGLQRQAVIGHTDAELFSSHLAAQYRVTDLSVIESGQSLEIEDFVEGPKGRQYYLTFKFPVRAADGGIRGICGMTSNITARKLAETAEREQRTLAEALSNSAAALNSTLNFEDVLDRILDNVGRVVPHDSVGVMLLDAERQTAQIVGYRDTREQPVDLKGIQFVVSQTRNLREMQASGAPLIIADTRTYDGWITDLLNAWIRASLDVPITVKGEIIGFLCLASAMPNAFTPQDAERLQAFANHAAIAIENARLYEEIQKLALIDMLTGSFNRTFFETELARMELGRDFPVSIVIADLDNMKMTNDRLGHAAGDELLKRTAQVLRAVFRSADVVARIGGDEFAVLLPNTDAATVEQMLSRIQTKLTEHNAQHPELPIQFSLGMATVEQGKLMKAFILADQRMYANKAMRKAKEA